MKLLSVLILSFFTITIVSGCARTHPTLAYSDQAKEIKNWDITPMYELRDDGTADKDLGFIDDLLYEMQERYQLPLTRTPTLTTGHIKVHIVRANSGGMSSITALLSAPGGEHLSRIKLESKYKRPSLKTDAKLKISFLKLVAKEVMKIENYVSSSNVEQKSSEALSQPRDFPGTGDDATAESSKMNR